MLFNTSHFIILFLPIVLVGFFLIGRWYPGFAALWVALASLFFYGAWDPRYVPLLLGSILVNYCGGVAIAMFRGRSRAKPLLIALIALNLCLLGIFKYVDFLVGTLNSVAGARYPLPHIVLPLGISFFTFTQIAFLVDVHRGIATEHKFIHYLLFVTYFPHLIAGPVLHHKQMMPQFSLEQTYRFQIDLFTEGLALFIIGLAKKIILADGLSGFVGPLFGAADTGACITFFEAWGAALAYTFQLYFDFSGYSDMAIGISLLFGIRLPLNFSSPYKAVNMIEFWRRWHMTLSTFLRDYLYVPLGGNRFGTARRYLNLMITMILGGLWHGANWTFVAWGTLHGGYLALNHAWQRVRPVSWAPAHVFGLPTKLFATTLTFLLVVVSWVIFRANSLGGGFAILKGLSGANGFVLPAQVASMFPFLNRHVAVVGNMPFLGGGSVMGVFEQFSLISLAAALCFAAPSSQDMSPRLRLWAVTSSMGFIIQGVFFGHVASPFLYFQF